MVNSGYLLTGFSNNWPSPYLSALLFYILGYGSEVIRLMLHRLKDF